MCKFHLQQNAFRPATAVSAHYLTLFGGYTTFDQGCTAWGTSRIFDSNFFGDDLGEINLIYQDGSRQIIPLIYGYNLWNYGYWSVDSLPFSGNEDAAKVLASALYLYGAREHEECCALRIEVAAKPVCAVTITGRSDKQSQPLFYGGIFHDDPTVELLFEYRDISGKSKICRIEKDHDFFASHTIKGEGSAEICGLLKQMNRMTAANEEDFSQGFRASREGRKIVFSGDEFAELATEIYHANCVQLEEKVDKEGFFHTSSKGTYLWHYQGFGPYVQSDAYYDKIYSRDAGRGILSLILMGDIEKAESAIDCLNKWLMYYPEQESLTFGGERVLGHWSVMPNQPFIYSKLLAHSGWPTRFTEEEFGPEYANLGNLETDGHGLIMMATYALWIAGGRSESWIKSHYPYIREAAEFLVWQSESPLTFTKNGLLYGETEAAMNDYTLYANIPCMLGLYGYAEMASAMGEAADSERWTGVADDIKAAINTQLTEQGKWRNFGFFHDPVLTMFFDCFGAKFKEALPESWLERSHSTYEGDISDYVAPSYFGPRGLGYDHNMITQNALLQDRMQDGSRLIENLVRLCYSPRLPQPFIAPEGATVRPEEGIYRRQGDLGNLVQQAETVKTFLLMSGISLSSDGQVNLQPRLPENWNLSFFGQPLPGCRSRDDKQVTLTGTISRSSRRFSMKADFENADPTIRWNIRFGPFPKEYESVSVRNGQNQTVTKQILTELGDSKWLTISGTGKRIALTGVLKQSE